MIPVAERAAEVVNTLGGEVLDLGFSSAPEDMVHIMDLLTNLYSDNETAAIREYSTNAFDAQLENGVAGPIVVTTPTLLNPYLRIRDRGCGLSADDFRNMWRKYGKSSKRDRVDQNGSMGIGAKSGLAYTNQFSIVSVKNGTKVHVSISRKASGGASAEIVSVQPTDEESGTEIVIPSERYNHFADKAKRLFRYWEKGTVLLDGEDPSERHKLIKITDRIFQNPYSNDDYVFMGNVPYPVRDNIGTLRMNGHGVIAFVTMGGEDQVKFSPSRESLIYNDQTNSVLESLTKEYDEHVIVNVKAEVDKCTSYPEAFSVYREIRNRYYNWDDKNNTLTFKGENFPPLREAIHYTIPPFKEFDGDFSTWAPSRSRNVTFKWNQNWEGVRWVVYNYPTNSAPTGDHRRKTRMYVTDVLQKGFGSGNIIYVRDPQPEQFHNYKWHANKFIDWEEIRRIRFTTNRSQNPKTDNWQVQTKSYGGYVIRDDIEPDAQIIYWSSARDRDIDAARYDLLTRHYPDAILIREPATRHTRLVREFPNSTQVLTALQAIREKLEKIGVSAEDQEKHDVRSMRDLSRLDSIMNHAKRTGVVVKDKRLVELWTIYNQPAGKGDYSQNTKDLMLFVGSQAFKPVPKSTMEYISINYPLLGHVNTYSMHTEVKNDLVDYINKKYKERKAK